MEITIDENKLKTIIDDTVQKAVQKEIKKWRALVIENVSVDEQKNIEELYGEPTNDYTMRKCLFEV